MSNNQNSNIINFKNIHVGYGKEHVLENINLTIKENEHWVILGANGSGKTTLLKLFSNDLYPSTKYRYEKNIFGKSNWNIFELKKKLGIITNELHNYYEFYGNYVTAYEIILSGFHSSIGIYTHQSFTTTQKEKAKNIIDFLELSHIIDKPVAEMSTGELRRCIIGRALIHSPKALILDEPTVGLDIKAQNQFLSLLKRLAKTTTIILITHHIDEIFNDITHVALLYKNTIYKQGLKTDILNSKNLSEIFEEKIVLDSENDRYFIKSVG